MEKNNYSNKSEFITKYIIIFFLILSLLLFLYTFFKSEIVWKGEKLNYYKLYYFISLSIILINIFIFLQSSLIQKYYIISVISVIFSLYLVEAQFTINQVNQKKLALDKNENNEALTAFYEFKKGNEKIRVPVPPYFYHLLDKNYKIKKNVNFFPLSGVSNSLNINCNEAGFYSIFESDRYGFNNPDEVWDKEKIDYLLIGDSFVLGDCVNRPKDIASVLRKLSKKNVINLGYKGNGPLMQYATLKEYFKKEVKNILWFYYEGNDLEGLIDELQVDILRKYLKDKKFSQNLILKQKKIDKINNNLIEKNKDEIILKLSKPDGNPFIGIESSNYNYSKKYFVTRFLKLYNLREKLYFKKHSSRSPIKIPNEFKEVLLDLKYFSKKNNVNLYFIYLPEYKRYAANYTEENYDSIKKIVYDLNINFIDIHSELFSKTKNPLSFFPFEKYGHYNMHGYSEIAKHIFDKLE